MCRGLATLPATCIKSAKDIKHKISFLLQKPEPQSADQKQIKEETAAAAAAAATSVETYEDMMEKGELKIELKRVPTLVDMERWKESFSHIMSSEMGRSVFTSFLKSEYSEENMDFWVACENYKTSSPSKMAARAKKLYRQHVEADAPNEVNLDSAVREETRLNVKNACPACFDEAQKMIYILMEKDSYRRFLKSKLVQDLSSKFTTTDEMKNTDCGKKNHTLRGGA